MQINEQFWGGAEQSFEIVDGVKRTSYNLKDAFNQTEGVDWILPLNEELDTSISPWAINNNADVAKIAYGTSYRTNPESLDYAPLKFYSIHDFEKDSSIPIYFNIPQYAGNGGTAFNWFTRNGLAQANIYDHVNTTIGDYRTMVYPIREFEYSKLLYHIQLVYGRSSDTDLGSPSITSVDDYFSESHSDAWRDDRPIVGIGFVPYYRGYDAQYPTAWRQCPWNLNTLGRKKPCEVAPPGAAVGYNVDFLDDFMSLISSGAAIGAWRNNYGGTGRIRIYNGSVWATTEEQCASIVLSTSYDTEPILHVPILDDESKWITNSHWNGTQDIQFRTELDHTKFTSYSEMKEYILTQAAYLGTWFITDANTVNTNPEPGSSDAWYLGEIDENGVTTGNYRQGSSTAELPNSEWENPWDSSGWSGRSEDPTPWDSSQTTELTTISYDPAYGSEEYIVSSWALYEICRVLNYFKVLENEDFPLTGEIYRGICERLFGSTDPLESILSVVVYPLDIRTDFVSDTTEQVLDTTVIGDEFRIAYAEIPVVYDTSAAAADSIRLSNAAEISRINWLLSGAIYGEAEIPYYANYKSFLDYEPYSSAELYIPFCGSVKLDPEIYIGHQIKVKYVLSPTDGTVKAYIMRDNLVIDTLTGNMGAAVTLYTSDEVARANNVKLMEATMQSQKQNKLKQAASFFTGAAGTLAGTGNGGTAAAGIVSGLVSTVFNTSQTQLAADQTQLRIDTAETPFKQLQSGGGYLSLIDELAIRLVVYRPEPLPGYSYDNWREYGHTTGFACLVTGRLSEFSGYTECNNVITDGIPCTATEKKMIIEALQSGVYL